MTSRSCVCTDNHSCEGWEIVVVLCFWSSERAEEHLQNISGAGRSLRELWWIGQVVPGIRMCYWRCWCWIPITFLQLHLLEPASSLTLHQDGKCFRRFSYCPAKNWKHKYQEFWLFFNLKKNHYFLIVIHIYFKCSFKTLMKLLDSVVRGPSLWFLRFQICFGNRLKLLAHSWRTRWISALVGTGK